MKISEIMTKDLGCCRAETSLQRVAQMMAECDCGAIPVVDNEQRPIGVITDRDIVIRTLAEGKNPMEMIASDCMTSPVDTVGPETSLDDCCEIMERDQIRRLLIVDRDGCLCGIVAQADIALHSDRQHTAEVVERVSQRSQAT